jgi:peptide/nickel transport system substrate-binding protein
MERNPYFWAVDPAGNQLPYIDRITHAFFDNIEVLNFKILNGEIDCQNRHVSSANYTVFRENEEKGDYRLIIWKDAQTYAYHFNLSWNEDEVLQEIINDQRFREAVTLCIDREEVNDLVFDGTLEPRQHSPVTGSPEFKAEYETYMIDYDPDQANALLDDMGLTERDGDDFRLRPDGERLTLRLTYALASFAGSDDMHLLLQEYLDDIGVELLMEGVERSLHEERADNNQIMVHSWVTDRSAVVKADPNWYLGASNELWWLWRNTNGAEGSPPPEGHLQQTLWDMWDQVQIEPNEGKRNEMFDEILDLNIKAMWNVGVCGEAPALFVTKNNFRNVPEGLVQDDPLRAIGLGQPMQFFIRSS